MTIIYQYKVATTSLGGFVKLLAAWRGSVYKLMFKEMLIFGGAYTLISITYRLGLSLEQKLMFEKIVQHCDTYTSLIPVSFVLGFYVSFVVKRWWEQFMNVPWPDRTLFIMNTYLHSDDDRARIMRRTVARYMLLSLIIITRSVSVAVMKRFPTMDHIIQAGFATKEEIEIFDNTKCKYNKFWVPLMWANNILIQARRERKIENDFGLRMIIEQLATFRDKCSLCFVYDWITIPLVYTQVATLAVYIFFATCLLGRQYLDPEKGYKGYDLDLYVPLFTMLQFFFYMGWLKVAEQLINPFGEDDDDFEINWLLDRHTEVAFSLVDQCYGKYPGLVQDKFWNDEVVPDLPYTEASLHSKKPNYLGSTYNLSRPSAEEQKILIPSSSANGVRHRNKGSFGSNISGSVISLFTGRSNNQKQFYDSRQSLYSNTGQDRLLIPQTNGGPGYLKLPTTSIPNTQLPARRASFDISDSPELDLQRERANTDHSERDIPVVTTERERKFSTPFNFTFFRKEKDEKPDSTTPKPSRLDNTTSKPFRFHVEPVTNDPDQDFVPPKTRRSGQVMCQLEKYNSKHNNISRPPVLSAIEEGGTIHSILQLPLSADSSDLSDPFLDPHRRTSTDTNRSISSWEEDEEIDDLSNNYNNNNNSYNVIASNIVIPEIVIEECK